MGFTLWLWHSQFAMERKSPFFSSANHLFLWIIYTMAMLNNQMVNINMNVNLGLINPALSWKATRSILISVVGCHYFGWYPTNSSTRFCWFEVAMAVHGSTIQLRMLTGWICFFGDLVVWECIFAMLLPQYSNMEVSINGGTPKWMVYNWKSYEHWWFGGTPHFRKPPYTHSQHLYRLAMLLQASNW
jgi:hypothetical protein